MKFYVTDTSFFVDFNKCTEDGNLPEDPREYYNGDRYSVPLSGCGTMGMSIMGDRTNEPNKDILYGEIEINSLDELMAFYDKVSAGLIFYRQDIFSLDGVKHEKIPTILIKNGYIE